MATRTLVGKGPKNTVQVSTDHMTNTSNYRTNMYYNTFVSLREKNTGRTKNELPVLFLHPSWSSLSPLELGSDHAGSGAPPAVWEELHQAGQKMHQTKPDR